jgi:integrase
MPISIQSRGARFQLRVKHKLLPAAFFNTYDTEAEARAYGVRLEGLLNRGIVPLELSEAEKRGSNPTLARIITQYLAESNCATSDRATAKLISDAMGDTRLLGVTPAWADLWVSGLKVADHLAPGTIRKRVECLARVIDWYRRKMGEAAANPLRSMPRGYASPTADELTALKAAGLDERRDEHRDRRLDAGELERIRSALAGTPRPNRQRALPADPAFTLLFELILATGMRLSEAYSLRVEQIDFARWVIKVAGSKGHRGHIKPRTVPMVRSLRVPLQNWCRDRVGLVFAFWDGTPKDKPKCTSRLSGRFGTLFDYAGVDDCIEHDLRHCATCAWFELRDATGRWVFSEIEICKIMGWSDTRMALRYASLRGEDLAARLG